MKQVSKMLDQGIAQLKNSFTWLMNCNDPSSRLVRWRLKLLEYDYEIKYKPGRINTNADFLSRPINRIGTNELNYHDFRLYH